MLEGCKLLISVTKHYRLSTKEKEFQKEGSNKVTEWGVKATEWKEWLKNKETELGNQGTVGTEPVLIKQQQNELEVNLGLGGERAISTPPSGLVRWIQRGKRLISL